MLDVKKVKKHFPIFSHNPDLVYLDSSASSLKPKVVIDKITEYYEKYSVNIFRGIYDLSEIATREYENTRRLAAEFLSAKNEREIIFVRNTTEAINLVAHSWGMDAIGKGDEIVTTIMEHHANFITWQRVCRQKKGVLKIAPLTKDGLLDKNELLALVTPRTKLVALTHVSNVLGTINPIKKIIVKIRKINPKCIILVDGAQSVPHMPVSVVDLGCDFYMFSGHKMLGPTGVGVLWGKYSLLEQMKPYQLGGEMIEAVYRDKTIYRTPPHKFEAGTPNIAGVIGLGKTFEYLSSLNMKSVHAHEKKLLKYASENLRKRDFIKIIGPQNLKVKSAVISMVVDGVHAHDVSEVLNKSNICLRSGHHCAMPLHTDLGISATVRASFYVYNDFSDIDKLIEALMYVHKKFS